MQWGRMLPTTKAGVAIGHIAALTRLDCATVASTLPVSAHMGPCPTVTGVHVATTRAQGDLTMLTTGIVARVCLRCSVSMGVAVALWYPVLRIAQAVGHITALVLALGPLVDSITLESLAHVSFEQEQ